MSIIASDPASGQFAELADLPLLVPSLPGPRLILIVCTAVDRIRSSASPSPSSRPAGHLPDPR